MSCLGVLFAVDMDRIKDLRGTDMDRRPEFIAEMEEEMFDKFPERVYELDKSWEAMHRLLTDGELGFGADSGLGLVILGGDVLYYDGEEHDDYIITAKSPKQVREVSRLLSGLAESEIKRRYDAVPEDMYEYKSEDDYEYTRDYLVESKGFWQYAAAHDLWVLFTADQ